MSLIVDSLTDEQAAFANHADEAFVEACPGAGKTRTIIARLASIGSTLPPRKGIAVLSFTNSAIEEFKERITAEGFGLLVRHPGFVGTFDSFVRHFLFLPTGIAGLTSRPHVVDSWDSLDIEIRLQGRKAFAGRGVSLDRFDSETGTIDPTRITDSALSRHVSANRAEYECTAQNRRQNLNRQGHFSANDARLVAIQYVRDPEQGPSIARAISARFQEIIVDEAQDCNPQDLEILGWLREAGLRITAVCDMDQSIYGFRDGSRQHLDDFANTYAPENRLTLQGNFRSSPAVCMLAASLRTRTLADLSIGPAGITTHPVAIYTYTGRAVSPAIGTWFLSHIERVGISSTDSIVLAHSERVARQAVGNTIQFSNGTSKVERLARAVGEFWSGTTKQSKTRSLLVLEKLLLDITGQRISDEPVPKTIERLGLDARVLRRQAWELMMRLPKTCANTNTDRIAWIECARAAIREMGLTTSATGQSLQQQVRAPANNNWRLHLIEEGTGVHLRYSTIHKAKGLEYGATCIVIPPDRTTEPLTTQLFDAWSSRDEYEPKRVVYVGVTRAIHLTALAIPSATEGRCVAILDAAGVPHEVFRSD